MRIVKSEIIYLSENEARSFVEVTRVLEGVIREGENPINIKRAQRLLDHMERFLEGCKDGSTEQEYNEENFENFFSWIK